MISTMHQLAAGLALTAVTALGVQAAGRVDVNFIEPAHFSDAGADVIERARTLRILGEHLQALGARLPDAQLLQVDVIDIDLAGRLVPRAAGEVRVLRENVDFARMTLRYTLLIDGRAVKAGEDRISEIDSPRRTGHLSARGDLAHDRALLERWFNERFAPGH